MNVRCPYGCFFSLLLTVFISSCGNAPENNDRLVKVTMPHLPYMGEYDVVYKEVNGKTVADTIYQTIPPFSFVSQDGKTVTEKDYSGKVYLADFFFTTCPSICPKMTGTLELVQEKLKDEPGFAILSHTIDPDHDSVPVLKEYAERHHADPKVWTFVTGDKEAIYTICEESYMSFAKADADEPGGYIHSGFLILIDKERHIRGAYDGTRPELADKIAEDVKILLEEYHVDDQKK